MNENQDLVTTDTAAAPPGTDEAVRSDRRTPLVLWFVMVVAFAGSIADVLMMKAVLDHFSGNEVISWLLGITIGMLCFGTALSAGIAIVERKRAAAVALVAAWAVLGVVLFALRYRTADMTRSQLPPNASDSVKFVAEQDYLTEVARDHMMAWVMIAVFVLVGVAVIVDTRNIWQPDLWAANRSGKQADVVHDELVPAEAELVRNQYQAAVQGLKEKMIGEDLTNQYHNNTHRGTELRQHARQRIIECSGDPSAVGLGRAPHVEHIDTAGARS